MSVHWFYIHVPILSQYNNLEDGVFFIYFRLFQTDITTFTTNIGEKGPSSIWCQDSNPQPSEIEYPPITTIQGLLFL